MYYNPSKQFNRICIIKGKLQLFKIMFQHQFDAKQIQQALPDYKYVKRLGSGAYAIVHLVQKRDTGQQLALKKVNCLRLGQYEKAGVANQARILSSLDHKNIIKVKSCLFDNNEDIMYIFMEYAQSGDLYQLITATKQNKKRVPQSTVWKVIADVSDGLQYLHHNQIIHRDLKPHNIFRMGKLFKIGDMNVSKVLKNGIAASTKTGSPLYTAPQVWNQQQYNEKCDIWSLGIVVYELCCQRVPYQAENMIQLINKINTQKPKSIPSCYSPTLDILIKKMMDSNAAKRITAQQVNKMASQKLKLQTQGLDEEAVDNLMDTIVFPDTHQRWINLIPCPLPPRTGRNQGLSKSQVQQRQVQSVQKQQVKLKANNSGIFRSSEKKLPLNIPKSNSRGKAEDKKEKQYELRVPNVRNLLPPLCRSGSPIGSRKKSQQRLQEKKQRSIQNRRSTQKKQKSVQSRKSQQKNERNSIQKRERSSSRTKRQSISQFINQTKSFINSQ